MTEGLSSSEALARLRTTGPNEPAPTPRRLGVAAVLGFLTNPLAAILLVACAVSAVLGDAVNATLIMLMVALGVGLDFVLTHRSQRAAERLREEVAPRATALRDGEWVEVLRRDLVPGDVVRLCAGDRIPADARLVECRDLHVHEAALTGESMPVEKEASGGSDRIFLGTSVVSGTGVAVVTATGRATAFGDIAARLSARPPQTEFERGLAAFAALIMKTVVFLVLFVVVAGVLMHRPPLQSLLFAVALAVGLTPEFLPVIVTVTLAQGAVRMARRRVIVKHLAAIEDFGSMNVLCSDKTGTLTTGEMRLDAALDFVGRPSSDVITMASLNATFQTGIRSPLDTAIVACATPLTRQWRKIDEIPFDFERRRLSVVVDGPGGRRLVTKGAPEAIVDLCVSCQVDGALKPLEKAERATCRATYEALGARGARVLAVAERSLPEQARYTAADECGLTLVGFLAFSDPPMPGVADAIAALRRDGVAVKILTGDSELVARHVGGQVGLDVGHIVLGADVERMSDAALAVMAEKVTVFARVSPGQKSRIIHALHSRGHVVGFLGDGINDAPSLHLADVGISVAGAVDVAKDAADIILRERSLDVLHQGILEGRRAFANVMKYLLMGTSSNFGNMVSMAAAALFLPFLPMLPTQILLNNFLYDLAQVTIPTDHVDDAMVQRPRRWNIAVIRNFMILIGPISSVYDFLTFGVLLGVFRAGEAAFHTGWFVESLATQVLVIFVIRTAGNPLASRPSVALAGTTLAVVVVGALLPFTPFAEMLGFVPLPTGFFLFVAAATLTYLVLVEVVKRRVLGRALGASTDGVRAAL
jgi:Mg2+-importing ATPase